MNKGELINYIAEQHDCNKAEAEKIINIFTSAVTQALSEGQDVALIGFGNFSVSKAAAREGRNPQTGKAITIAARNQPRFSAGKGLKDACNGKQVATRAKSSNNATKGDKVKSATKGSSASKTTKTASNNSKNNKK